MSEDDDLLGELPPPPTPAPERPAPRPFGRTPATQSELAMFGHVGGYLRDYLATHNMTVADFNEVVLRTSRDSGVAYKWLQGKAAPRGIYRSRIAEALGIPEEALDPVSTGDEPAPPPPKRKRNRSRARPPAEPAAPRRPPAEVMGITVSSDGMVTIKVSIRATLARAAPIVQMLMDDDLILTGTPEEK